MAPSPAVTSSVTTFVNGASPTTLSKVSTAKEKSEAASTAIAGADICVNPKINDKIKTFFIFCFELINS